MTHITTKIIAFMLSMSIACQALAAEQASIFQSIAQDNLPSLLAATNEPGPSDQETLAALISDDKTFDQVLLDTLNQQMNPNLLSKRQAVFAMLAAHELSLRQDSDQTENGQSTPSLPSITMDRQTTQDLELFCGGKKSPTLYLADKLCKTHTEIGRALLYAKIAQPIADQQALRTQQEIVREFATNDELFNFVSEQLTELSASENATLSFWGQDMFGALAQQVAIHFPFAPGLSNAVNKNEYLQECSYLVGEAASAIGMGMTVAAAVVLPSLAVSKAVQAVTGTDYTPNWLTQKDQNGRSYVDALESLLNPVSLAGICCWGLSKLPRQQDAAIKLVKGVQTGMSLSWMTLDYKIRYTLFYLCFQRKMQQVANYLRAVQSVAKHLKQHPFMAQHFSDLDAAISLEKASDDMAHLLEMLQTDTFKGEPSMFSFTGRIIAAYRLMMSVKQQLIPALVAIGKVDMQVGIARLVREHRNMPAGFCFPEFIDPTAGTTPLLNIEQGWYPIIDATKAVPNSIMLGTFCPPNAVITGPNAGGKSTVTKMVIINVLLAQSLGIAAAQSMSLTPFTKIMTYLNIVDDVGAGDSLFAAGLKRAQEIADTVKLLEKNQFSFTAIDEVFNGTNVYAGSAAAFALIEHLGMLSTNLCITPTHFPTVSDLAHDAPDRFTNYMVPVYKDANGKLVYPYKLEPGINRSIITFDMMQEMGIEDALLVRAREKFQELHGQLVAAPAAA